jgi:hypothetical protein
LKCAERAYFDDYGKCVAVSDHCRTWDEYDGQCLSCYQGYHLTKGGKCLEKEEKVATDRGCAKWDWDNQVCIECSTRFYMTEGGCKSISDFCAEYDDSWGECTKCYKGYDLVKG